MYVGEGDLIHESPYHIDSEAMALSFTEMLDDVWQRTSGKIEFRPIVDYLAHHFLVVYGTEYVDVAVIPPYWFRMLDDISYRFIAAELDYGNSVFVQSHFF